MNRPLILSTWTFGQRANRAAWPILSGNGAALDAVEAACRDAEADPTNYTVGLGGYPDRDGEVTLDASIMLSPAKRGAVCALKQFAHPISIARRVMEKTPHVLLAGEGAATFAREQGFEPTVPIDGEALAAWKEWSLQNRAQPRTAVQKNIEEGEHDTIGVLAIDASGTLAGACSTSGLRFKLPGRVGDSPIIGHALYVDPEVGAAVTTGHGELVMSVCGAFLGVETMRRGASPLDAAVEVLQRIVRSVQLTDQDQVGIIVLASDGQWRGASLRPGFKIAVKTGQSDELVDPYHVQLR